MVDAKNNGNKDWWIRWLVGSLWALLIIAVTTIGTNVIANENNNKTDHREIRTEVHENQLAQMAILTEIKVAVGVVQTKVENIEESM